jgi:GDP-L-fucose synthase
MEKYDGELFLNIGTGQDVSIRELADLVRELVYPEANIVWDDSKPDGTPRKLLNVDRIHALGWQHRIELAEGIKMTYAWFCEQVGQGAVRQAVPASA